MDETPKKPWWRRRRWQFTLAFVWFAFYLLAFVPTGWALLRIDSDAHPTEWAILAAWQRPTAAVLTACPEPVRDAVITTVNHGRPEGGWTMYENSEAGMRIGMYRRESPTSVTDVRIW